MLVGSCGRVRVQQSAIDARVCGVRSQQLHFLQLLQCWCAVVEATLLLLLMLLTLMLMLLLLLQGRLLHGLMLLVVVVVHLLCSLLLQRCQLLLF